MLSLRDFAELASSLSGSAVHWCHQGRLSRSGVAELTRVGHELKRATEFPVAGRGASAHMEHIGSEGGETFDVGVPWRGFYDSVASFILVLRMTDGETETETKREQSDVVWCSYSLLKRIAILLEILSSAEITSPIGPSPSHSTWPHTPGWPRWLYPVAARPVRWCVLWYPSPGWKWLEKELVRWSKKDRKSYLSPVLSPCLFSVALLNPPLFAPAGKVKQWAMPQGNHFHLSLNLASIQSQRRYRAVWPQSWIANARVYGNTLN